MKSQQSRIDDQTTVSLGLMASLFVVCVGATITGSFYVFRVDARLARIENKLGISESITAKDLTVIPDASAGMVIRRDKRFDKPGQ